MQQLVAESLLKSGIVSGEQAAQSLADSIVAIVFTEIIGETINQSTEEDRKTLQELFTSGNYEKLVATVRSKYSDEEWMSRVENLVGKYAKEYCEQY